MLLGMSDSGMHKHAGVFNDLNITTLDGFHDHEFKLPNGSTVKTAEGGGHAHVIDRDFGHTVHGGVHAHYLTIDGVEYRTEVDGWHSHEFGESSVAEGGVHSHALVLAEVTVISELTDTSKSKRKKGADRARRVSAKHLDHVARAAFAILTDLQKDPTKKATRKVKL